MRILRVAAVLACVVGFSVPPALATDYDACNETFYDYTDEPCGGGHQHTAGKREETSLELSRHRHRYLEVQLKQLQQTVTKLSDEIEQLKKAVAK